MCGIVGYLGKEDALEVLIEGLKRLEYRGYDSAGVGVLRGTQLQVIKSVGKVKMLEKSVRNFKCVPQAQVGIGHTRWATHGRPSETNAHPHQAGPIALVHNGIIENYMEIKSELEAQGHTFQSDTDSEVVAQLVLHYYNGDLLQAVGKALKELKGTYAIAVISQEEPGRMVGARKDSPLVLGLGEEEFFLASDIPAILPYTKRIVLIENGDRVLITRQGVTIVDKEEKEVRRQVERISWSTALAEKAGYKHFMQKEIFEQPRALVDTLQGYCSAESGEIYFPLSNLNGPLSLKRVIMVACGTSWHAALVGKLWMEPWTKLPVEVDIASEFRAREPFLDSDTLVIFISQSGETADTLAALRLAQEKGAKTLAICNVMGSSIARESQGVIYTHAGPEIGVASTKAFITQMLILYLLSIDIAHAKKEMEKETVKGKLKTLLKLPGLMEETLSLDKKVEHIARKLLQNRDFLYLGRWLNYPIALEGALKLKEISYIHAEGYPAGEMKHGPIALIEEDLPVVTLVPKDRVYDKMAANVEEIKSRNGTVVAVGTYEDPLEEKVDHFFPLPAVEEELSPFLTVLPLQLLAYIIAYKKGCDVDQPRNLAKSVTVE